MPFPRSFTAWLGAALIVLALSGRAADPAAKPDLPADVRQEAQEMLETGGRFLLTIQKADGTWGKYKMPALTSLAVMALHDAPVDPKLRQRAIGKGLEYILSCANDDGSIAAEPYKVAGIIKMSNYANYNTSISLLALATLGGKEHVAVMKKARAYLKQRQVSDRDATGYGGFGYAAGKKADLSNTAWAAEALHYTEYLDREPLDPEPEQRELENKKMKAALTKFLDEAQNVSDDPDADAEEADGGLGYRPGLVSSGSMTYAGLKSMIYADLDRDDPRVKGVLSFIKNNYTLEKNPGQEMKGYYYYLHALAKALDAWGHDTIVTADGTKHHWRRELIAELAERQLRSGSWINQDGRYMESMPDMVTAYCMIALKYALGEGLRAPE